MNLSRIFIERPIMTTLVMVGILLFGVVGYFKLPVSDLPNVDFPTIQVSANLPGANPETMAASVATPLEQQFSTIAGLDSMNSSSSLNSTQVTLQFNLNRNLDAAAQDVQAAISTAQRKLPDSMPSPPSLRKVNPADQPVIYLALSSSYLPLSQVDDYAQTLVAQRISMVNGVAQVMVFGSQKFAVRTQLDPESLFSRKIGVDEVISAIQSGNVNLPIGTLFGTDRNFTIQANGQLMKAADYRPLIIAYRNGSPVRLSDVGNVIDSVENPRQASWFNGTRAIILAVQRQPGTNTIQVINDIKNLLPTFETVIPPSVHLDVLFDRSNSIRNSVSEVQFTLFVSIVLVVLVIFLFLRSFFATLIASLALPMSIVGTFAAMALLGYSINNLSLMALTLSVGFVIDDAIVMLENITRHMEMGKSAIQAAFDGAEEIGFTILSMTISLVAVFIPILFMGGLIGRLFNEFAMTITIAILVSGVVSLTLTPMLCSRFLKPQDLGKSNPILAAAEYAFEQLTRIYDWTLQQSLHYRGLVLIMFIASAVFTVILFGTVSKGFMPSDDTNQIFGSTEGPQGISFTEMSRHQKILADIAAKEPGVASVMSSVDSSNTGRIFLSLKPRSERPHSSEEMIQHLRRKMAGVPGIKVYMQNPPSIRLGGQLTKSLYQLTLQSPNTTDLYKATADLEEKMKEIPGLQDVTTDLQMKNPQLNITIDRDRASALGVTVEQVERALSTAFGSQQISTIYSPNNTYQVITELMPEYQNNPDTMSLLYIRPGTLLNVQNNFNVSDSNAQVQPNLPLVPLSGVAEITRTVGPLTVSHMGQFPSSTVSFNLQPGVSLGDKVEQIQEIARTTLPSTVRSSFQGSAQAFQSSQQGIGVLIVLAILVIYLVLGILYESFIHPLTILSGLPAAGLGALLTLLLFHKELDIYGFLGLIMLIGIVKKNAIMMIDFALSAQRNEGYSPEEAIYQACLVRFRPIMMTTLAALMGTLPIAVGFGASGESRQSLGLAVFGGLIVSQLLTLYITPVIYIYLDNLLKRFSKNNYGDTAHA